MYANIKKKKCIHKHLSEVWITPVKSMVQQQFLVTGIIKLQVPWDQEFISHMNR